MGVYCCLLLLCDHHSQQLETCMSAPQRLIGPTGIPGSKVIKETWVYQHDSYPRTETVSGRRRTKQPGVLAGLHLHSGNVHDGHYAQSVGADYMQYFFAQVSGSRRVSWRGAAPLRLRRRSQNLSMLINTARKTEHLCWRFGSIGHI